MCNHCLYLLASDSLLSLLWSASESELITIASSRGSNGLVIATPDKRVSVLSLFNLFRALDTFILPLKHPLHPNFPPHLIPTPWAAHSGSLPTSELVGLQVHAPPPNPPTPIHSLGFRQFLVSHHSKTTCVSSAPPLVSTLTVPISAHLVAHSHLPAVCSTPNC